MKLETVFELNGKIPRRLSYDESTQNWKDCHKINLSPIPVGGPRIIGSRIRPVVDILELYFNLPGNKFRDKYELSVAEAELVLGEDRIWLSSGPLTSRQYKMDRCEELQVMYEAINNCKDWPLSTLVAVPTINAYAIGDNKGDGNFGRNIAVQYYYIDPQRHQALRISPDRIKEITGRQ